MSGAPDPAYVSARHVLLDALEALRPHLDALVLVGAQAVYLHTGEGDLAVAPYTTDADLAIDPGALSPRPEIEESMRAAGFVLGEQPGIWLAAGGVEIDLLVPEAVGGGGRRGALLVDDRSATVTEASIEFLRVLFGEPAAPGSQMAARAAQPLEDPATIAASVAVLAVDLLAGLE